jgi:hypothetical protein
MDSSSTGLTELTNSAPSSHSRLFCFGAKTISDTQSGTNVMQNAATKLVELHFVRAMSVGALELSANGIDKRDMLVGTALVVLASPHAEETAKTASSDLLLSRFRGRIEALSHSLSSKERCIRLYYNC